MDFPIVDLMDPDACHQFLVRVLQPCGLRCPPVRPHRRTRGHDRHRPPVLNDRCRCGAVFNAYTGTPLPKTLRTPAPLVLLRGIWHGGPTARLARELGCDWKHLLPLRHRLPGLAETAAKATGAVSGAEVEADEMFQNAGGKGVPDPADPPRRRANKRRGHGNFADDRPPVVGGGAAARPGRRSSTWSHEPARSP